MKLGNQASTKVANNDFIKELARIVSRNYGYRFDTTAEAHRIKSKIQQVSKVFLNLRLYNKNSFYVFTLLKDKYNRYHLCGVYTRGHNQKICVFEDIMSSENLLELEDFIDKTLANPESYYNSWLFADFKEISTEN